MNKRLIKSNDEGGGASFNTVLYTGNGSTSGPILDVGFVPDFVWIKSRETSKSHRLHDIVRGENKFLQSNLTTEEVGVEQYIDFDYSSTQARITNNSFGWNESGIDYVAWCWKAGGDAVTNTDGTITSEVSANVDAGFSIVSYTGSPSSTVGHGLGQTPDFIFLKIRTNAQGWATYHSALGREGYLEINSTAAVSTLSNYWGTSGIPNSNVFGTGPSAGNGNANGNIIAYCFAEVEGFSSFGSYVGNGSTSGPTVVTGFEPAFVMIKNASGTGNWLMFDNKRSTSNPLELNLDANNSEAEENNVNYRPSFLENGFSIAGTSGGINTNGSSYIYMAFANQF